MGSQIRPSLHERFCKTGGPVDNQHDHQRQQHQQHRERGNERICLLLDMVEHRHRQRRDPRACHEQRQDDFIKRYERAQRGCADQPGFHHRQRDAAEDNERRGTERRRRFLDGDEADQIEILKEILRLEPQASMIYRTSTERVADGLSQPVEPGQRLSLDIRAANLDEAMVGPDPTHIDPDRARRMRNNGAWMSFGDGSHFCPGWQVGLTESRVILDRLFRLPGLRLVRYPDLQWTPPMLQSYQFTNAVIECDRE